MSDRPYSLPSVTHKLRLSCQHTLYLTIAENRGQIWEVEGRVGKAGSCIECLQRTLSKVMTLYFQLGGMAGKLERELEGTRCELPVGHVKVSDELERPQSCIDYMMKIFKRWKPCKNNVNQKKGS